MSGEVDAPNLERKRKAAVEKSPRHYEFAEPVVIQRRRVDRDRVVTSTKVALASLVYEWPVEGCKLRLQAVRACLAAIKGKKSPAAARRAFIAAAEAAGILREDFPPAHAMLGDAQPDANMGPPR